MDSPFYDIRPLGVGDLIDRAVWLYRDHFRSLILIVAVVLVPVGIFQVVLDLLAQRSGELGTIFLFGFISTVIGTAAQLLAFAGVTAAASQIVLSGRTSVVDAYDQASGSVIRLFKLIILVTLALGLLSITLIGIPAAIYVGISWLVAGQVLVLEKTGARAALGRSWGLLRGNRLRTAGIFILVAAITIIISLLFQIPAFALGYFSASSESGAISYRLAWLGGQFIGLTGEILISPLQFVAWTVLYFDLRARNEGLDLEMEVESIGYAPEPAPGLD